MTKEVLIVGGSSFIGFYTIKQFLANGYKVTVTTRNDKHDDYFKKIGVETVRFDLAKEETIHNLPKKAFESVILLGNLMPANVTSATTDLKLNGAYISTNVLGHIHLLNYCKQQNISRMISTTSYADTIHLWSNDKVIKESDGFCYSYSGDHSLYAIAKNTSTDISTYYNQEYGMKNVIFRFPPVYGVGPHTQLYDNGKLRKSGIALFIDLALEGKDITVFGEDRFRDVVYVKDVANAFVRASQSKDAHGLYNIMSGKSISLYEQAVVISEVFSGGRSKVMRNFDVPNNSKSYRYSIEKAQKDLAYFPEYVDFKKMMSDYKKEMENEEILSFFNLQKQGE